jgi:uncharacterized heparinase superfamily protein
MLVLGGTSAATVGPGSDGESTFTRMPKVRAIRKHSMGDDGAGQWPLQYEHDGYVSRNSLVVERRLRIDEATNELVGLDAVREVMTARRRTKDNAHRVPFALHFHLGSRVVVERIGASEIRLILQNGPALRFSAENHAVGIEPSRINGTAMGALQSYQLVVRGLIGHGDAVRWSLKPA